MKRTALKRKTPLQAKAPMKKRSRKKTRNSEARWRCPGYLAWIRTLPCACCGGTGGDAHHVIGLGWGLSGMGLTAPDSFAMPLCRSCHTETHNSVILQKEQPEWLERTLSLGTRRFCYSQLRDAMLFVNARSFAG